MNNLDQMDMATVPTTHVGCSEWRCTFPDLYTADCPGRDNPRARQGHYVLAYTAEQARKLVCGEGNRARVHVEEWKRWDEKGKWVWGAT